MTSKEKAKAYRALAADRAQMAAEYAKTKEYDKAARWYMAADNFLRIAEEFSNPRRITTSQ